MQADIALSDLDRDLGKGLEPDQDLVSDQLVAFEQKDVHGRLLAVRPPDRNPGPKPSRVLPLHRPDSPDEFRPGSAFRVLEDSLLPMEASKDRSTLCGVDEAGLGPLLGPLVVAGVAMSGPRGLCPWEALREAVRRKGGRREDRRIRIADSKRVKSGGRGLAELERTALALLGAVRGEIPETLGHLLSPVLGDRDFEAYPWYRNLSAVPLPRWTDGPSLRLDAHRFARALSASGVSLLAAPIHPVLVGSYNRLIGRLDNKSLALFAATLPVLRACLEVGSRAGKETVIVLDRQGGRSRYAPLLRDAFPGVGLEVLEERSGHSAYRLGQGVELHFAERGEEKAFPTAAASCLAKYVRECLIERLNRFFQDRRPSLRATAGYWTDGRRFLDDLGPELSGRHRSLLVRCR